MVAGSDTSTTSKIVGTFSALRDIADFSVDDDIGEDNSGEEENAEGGAHDITKDARGASKGMRPEFHYNLQIQLPANGDEETYIKIFSAIRKVFD